MDSFHFRGSRPLLQYPRIPMDPNSRPTQAEHLLPGGLSAFRVPPPSLQQPPPQFQRMLSAETIVPHRQSMLSLPSGFLPNIPPPASPNQTFSNPPPPPINYRQTISHSTQHQTGSHPTMFSTPPPPSPFLPSFRHESTSSCGPPACVSQFSHQIDERIQSSFNQPPGYSSSVLVENEHRREHSLLFHEPPVNNYPQVDSQHSGSFLRPPLIGASPHRLDSAVYKARARTNDFNCDSHGNLGSRPTDNTMMLRNIGSNWEHDSHNQMFTGLATHDPPVDFKRLPPPSLQSLCPLFPPTGHDIGAFGDNMRQYDELREKCFSSAETLNADRGNLHTESSVFSALGNVQTGGNELGLLDRDQLRGMELENREDALWLRQWTLRRGNLVHGSKRSRGDRQKKTISLHEFRALLAEAIILSEHVTSLVGIQSDELKVMNPNREKDFVVCDNDVTNKELRDESSKQISNKDDKLSPADNNCLVAKICRTDNGTTVDELPSCENTPRIAETKMRLQEICSIIDNEDILWSIKQRLQRACKKRSRLKRKRKELYEHEQEQMERQERIEVEIAQWKNDIYLKEIEIKKEKEMKKAADEILAEVRRKLTEGRRSVRLLTQLRKLRDVRKEKALQKGVKVSEESDKIFEERVGAAMESMQKQIAMYVAEEQTLEVMLDMEQEETLVRERIARRKKEEEKLLRYEEQLCEHLFGIDNIPSPADPLYPYRQFYDVGLHVKEAFIRIRQDWDMFAVGEHTPGGSSVPIGWVQPVEPSSEVWASALVTSEPTLSAVKP